MQKLTNHCARRASAWQARASESVANAVGDVAEFSLGLKLQCIPSASANFVQKCTATPSTTTDLPPADGPTAQTSAHLHACALLLRIALFTTLAALLCQNRAPFRFLAIFGGNSGKIHIHTCFGINSGCLGRNKYSICQNSRQQQLYDVRVCKCGGGAAAVGGQCNCEFAKCIGLNRQGHEEGARVRQQQGAIHKYSPPPSRARAFITLKNKSDSAMSQGTIMSVSINNGSFQL